MTLFNTQGELNGLSDRDALAQIVKYASMVQNNQSVNQNLTQEPSFTEEQKNELLRRALLTTEGKVALGQAINC